MVPETLREMVANWQKAKQPRQPDIPWPRDRWIAAFPDDTDDFQSLPDRLDRASIRAACVDAPASPEAARWAFLAAMAWGYGGVGYGQWRSHRVLDAQGASERLAEVARSLAEDGAIAAYERFSDSCRLYGLGPAFGTKFLYFCPQAEAGPSALILDRVVSDWLRNAVDTRINPVPWSPRTYRTYVGLLGDWADELDVTPSVIEELIFVSNASGQWANQ